jgi:hypothetical protein
MAVVVADRTTGSWGSLSISTEPIGWSRSIGIALYPEHARDVTGLLRCADTRCVSPNEQRGPEMYLGPRLNSGSASPNRGSDARPGGLTAHESSFNRLLLSRATACQCGGWPELRSSAIS